MTTTLDELHVLVVDDDPVALVAATALLESMGHSTVTHDHGLGTSSVIFREKPQVVLLDIKMPDLDGDQLVSIIHQCRWSPDAPWPVVILHSGRSAEELEETVKATNAAGAIEKAQGPARFRSEFRRIVESCARAYLSD